MAATNVDISIIMPVLNEAGTLESALLVMPRGVEVVVVDGGSEDETSDIAFSFGAKTITAPRGRGAQMNAGAREATGAILVFLHADTRLPARFREVMERFARSNKAWGRFDVRLSGHHPLFRVIAFMMNLRSRFTGISTGDQAIFVKRPAFEALGGYSEIPLMEDIELSRRLLTLSWPFCSHARVTTSSRRWEERGIMRTMLLMWQLRFAYFRGVAPEVLAERYR